MQCFSKKRVVFNKSNWFHIKCNCISLRLRLRDVLRLLLDAVTPRRLRGVLRLLLDDRGASSSTPGDALRLSRGALYGGLLEPNNI